MVARRIAGHIRTRVRSGLMLALKSGYIVYSPLMLKLKMGFGFLPSILLITAGLGFSQTGTGNIQGVVKDATGAVVPSATVTIVHTATGGQNKTQTNEVGFYFFPSIQVGEYQISAESAGMDAWKGALSLLAGQSAMVETVLKLGTTATAVTVAGDVTPLITTTSPTVATVVEHTRIEQLPLNGRNIHDLALHDRARTRVRWIDAGQPFRKENAQRTHRRFRRPDKNREGARVGITDDGVIS